MKYQLTRDRERAGKERRRGGHHQPAQRMAVGEPRGNRPAEQRAGEVAPAKLAALSVTVSAAVNQCAWIGGGISGV